MGAYIPYLAPYLSTSVDTFNLRDVCSQNHSSSHVIKHCISQICLLCILVKQLEIYYYSGINELQIYDSKSCILIFFIN